MAVIPIGEFAACSHY